MKNRLHLEFFGIVQGVGFRPKLFQIAESSKLTGWICNTGQGVVAEFEGPKTALLRLLERIRNEMPPPIQIHRLTSDWLELSGFAKLEIRSSQPSCSNSTFLAPDIRTCPACLAEMQDPHNRRYAYAFTSCTSCGPRFSITKNLPFDRPMTSLHEFKMCHLCQAEYLNPRDRRFHSQTNSCPKCGPSLTLVDRESRVVEQDSSAILAAMKLLQDGHILALKALGGFQLLCLANNPEAVSKLRERKHRPAKAFAVMFANLSAIEEYCHVNQAERQILESQAAPIVLLDAKPAATSLLGLVAPGLNRLGVMLPTSGLHHLLCQLTSEVLVVTSGNLSGESICIENTEAITSLNAIADQFLIHNYQILRAVDDSVVQLVQNQQQVLRRARGYAPLPLQYSKKSLNTLTTSLALGAHQKNTIAITLNNQVVGSQHLGDLQNEKSYLSFQKSIQNLCEIYSLEIDNIACDLHPDYLSTHFAEKMASQSTAKLSSVQHHYAHALSCVLDQDIELPVLAVVWDGAGYGDDAQIWGGEFLRLSEHSFSREISLRPFALNLSEKALRNPELIWKQVKTNLQITDTESKPPVPLWTSAGRIFDCAAAILGFTGSQSYEGEAAMQLQGLAELALNTEGNAKHCSYPLELKNNQLDWRAMLAEMEHDAHHAGPINHALRAQIALKFHHSLANGILQAARQVKEKRVLLSGGCFQNRLLENLVVELLTQNGFEVFWHHHIPPNDGGIAMGQALAMLLRTSTQESIG